MHRWLIVGKLPLVMWLLRQWLTPSLTSREDLTPKMQKSIVDVHFLLTVIEVAPKAKVIILQSWDFLPASIEQTINEGAVNLFTFSPPNANRTFRSDLPFLLLTVHLKFCRPKTHCFPEGILTKKKCWCWKYVLKKDSSFVLKCIYNISKLNLIFGVK